MFGSFRSFPIFWMRVVYCALVLLAVSTRAGAWGPTGHRITGVFAERLLTTKAKKKIKIFMGEESLAEASTWADEMRSHPDRKYYGKFDPWHYVEVPIGMNPIELVKLKTNSSGNVLIAIDQLEKTLRDTKSKPEEKREALRLFVHFIGDIHQPLHVGNGLDKGGNTCKVKWFGETTNLHRVWDEHLIDYRKMSYSEWVGMNHNATAAQIKAWQSSPVDQWASESIQIRTKLYPSDSRDAELDPKKRKYCGTSFEDKIDEKFVPNLKYDYAFDHMETVKLRLYQAGVRIAGRLNTIFR